MYSWTATESLKDRNNYLIKDIPEHVNEFYPTHF